MPKNQHNLLDLKVCSKNQHKLHVINNYICKLWAVHELFCTGEVPGAGGNPEIGSRDKGVHSQGGQDNFYVAWVFALELKLSKTLSGLVYSVLQL